MGVADHGGFDIVTECPFAALNAGLSTTPFGQAPFPLHQPKRIGPLICDILVNPAITALAPVMPANQTPPLVDSTVIDATAVLEVSAFDFGNGVPQPIAVQQVPVPVKFTIRTSLDVVGLAVGILFNPPGAAPVSIVSFSLDRTSFFSAPAVQALFIDAWLMGGLAAILELERELAADLEPAMREAELAALRLMPNFFVLGLTRLVPGGPLFTAGAAPPTQLAMDLTSTAIRLMITLAGTPGTPALISRSALRPGDVTSIIVSNTCLLRDCVRSKVAGAFGIPISAFSTTSPWFAAGPVAATFAGLPAGTTMTISNLQIGLDETQFLQIHFEFSVPAGFATSIDGTFTQQLLPSESTSTVGPPTSLVASPISVFRFDTSVPLTTIPKPIVTTHISHPWWFYLGLGLFYLIAPAAQALQDAINSALGNFSAAGAPLTKAFAGTSTAIRVPTMPSTSTPGVSIPQVNGSSMSVFQSTAIFAAIAGATPLFRDHDLVINLS